MTEHPLGKHSKYKLLLCEYWWENRHGSASKHIQDKLIVYQRLNYEDMFESFNSFCMFLCSIRTNYFGMVHNLLNNSPNYKHKIIRNFVNIISSVDYIQPEICEIVDIHDTMDNTLIYYTTCIKKTFWLKIFQRIWKKYYKKKRAWYGNLENLNYRSIYGIRPSFY